MKTHILAECSAAKRNALLRRPTDEDRETLTIARAIVATVSAEGDAAVRRWTKDLDNVDLLSIRVPEEECARAACAVDLAVKDAIASAAAAIETFHRSQVPSPLTVETRPGVTCRREWRPIDVVGIYVPGGTAPLVSTVLMLGVPARIAGCPTVVLCTPPGADASVPAEILFAARSLGITDVFRIGGAQAIGAMAAGTETVPRVHKIYGPGNRFVAAAKAIVAQPPWNAGIDLPAGPSELLVIADGSAPPSLIAADLLSQAEHGAGSQVVLVSPSAEVIASIGAECERRIESLPRKREILTMWESSFALVTRTIEEAVAFSNDYAPEHLQLAVQNAEELAPLIRNAGSVFQGPETSVVYGDYASGTNHTLPTGSAARWTGGITVESFMKSISFQSTTPDGRAALLPVVTALARAEGLEAHARAAEARRGR